MAYNKVKFLRGTSDEYAVAEKDSDTIYFTTNDGKLYIGDKEVSGDGSVTIDDTLSDTSTNPVQNKVIKQAIDNKADKTTVTKDTNGLMSAEDKSKLDNADNKYALKSKYGDTTINVGRKADSDVGEYSTAEGHNTTANGYASHAEGSNAYISNGEITFYDTRTVTISDNITVDVNSSYAYGVNSHAEGCQTLAYGNYSHAEGHQTAASGSSSHAEGDQTTASGGDSHAEGYKTIASGAQSHAEGVTTTASGGRSHAEGSETIASGGFCHAEGWRTTANGNNSCHAEGYQTTACGIATHVEGSSNNKATDLIPDLSWSSTITTNDDIINAWNTQKFSLAHGRASHVEGHDNLTLGYASHAEGQDTVAIGDHSHTSGYYTKALHENEAAYGTYNKSNSDTLFSIGDGTADDARHNAFEITKTGGKLHDRDIGISFTQAETAALRIEIPDGVDVAQWLTQNAKSGMQYFISFRGSHTGLPNAPADWMWFTYDGNRYFARAWIGGTHTADFVLDVVNSIGGWKEISYTPIKSTTISASTDGNGFFALWGSTENKVPVAFRPLSFPDMIFIPMSSTSNWTARCVHSDFSAFSSTAIGNVKVFYIEI